MKYESNYLQHHGIKGQKWGIRRFQNEDGTYTAEGKERYGRGSSDGKTRGLFFHKKHKPPFEVDRKAVEKDFDASVNEHSDVVSRIKENENKITKQADALSESYAKHLDNMKLSKNSKENIWNNLSYDFGGKASNVDDEELYEFVTRDYVYEEIRKSLRDSLPKDIKEKRKVLDRSLEKYWDDVHKISDPVCQKYKDKYIKDLEDKYDSWDPVDYEINNLISDKLGTSFALYLSRNFDYWVNDIPEFNKAVKRLESEFSYKEFQKRFP